MAKKHTDAQSGSIDNSQLNTDGINTEIETMDDVSDIVPSCFDKDIDPDDISASSDDSTTPKNISNNNDEDASDKDGSKITVFDYDGTDIVIDDTDITDIQSGIMTSKKFKEDVENFLNQQK